MFAEATKHVRRSFSLANKTVHVDYFSSEKRNEVKLHCFVARMLRKYSVMLPLYEHAHTRLFFFRRNRHLRIYTFDLRACFSSIHLRRCLLQYYQNNAARKQTSIECSPNLINKLYMAWTRVKK